jgi:hypothetical protein
LKVLLMGAMVAVVAIATAGAGSKWPSETVMEASFDVSPGGTLRVDVPDADLDLRTGSADEVRIEIRVSSRDLEKARQRFEKMNFRADGDAGGVTLTADRQRWSIDWGTTGFHIVAVIELPEEFDLDLRTSDGDIVISADGAVGADLDLRGEEVELRG